MVLKLFKAVTPLLQALVSPNTCLAHMASILHAAPLPYLKTDFPILSREGVLLTLGATAFENEAVCEINTYENAKKTITPQ